MNKIAVAILNWNGRSLLERYLTSVVEFSTEASIYVIDNASTDESVNYLKTNFPQVKLILLEENYGFAKGYNEGLKHIEEEYIVLLNSDVRVTKNWLKGLMNRLTSDEKIVAVQPKVKSDQQPTHFEYAGAAGGFLDWFAYPYCRGRIRNKVEEDKGQYNTATRIFWGSGACLAVKKSAFEIAGGFDEDYFAHMEEIDLCWRWNARGYEVWYVPSSEVFHLGGGSLANSSPKKTFLNFRNSLFNLVKNAPSRNIYLHLFLRMILDGVIGLIYLLQLKPKHFMAVLEAHFSFYRNAKRMFHKRFIPNKKLKYYACFSLLLKKYEA